MKKGIIKAIVLSIAVTFAYAEGEKDTPAPSAASPVLDSGRAWKRNEQLYKTETWENDKLIEGAKNNVSNNDATFTDKRDRQVYKTVKIGEQVWMAQNLNFAAEGGKCYGDDPENGKKYGRLYDWETAKKACPEGWHLPTNGEWTALLDYVGGEETAGTKLKAASGWNEDGNGTDEYGFSALPGGDRSEDGIFDNVGVGGYWWSASEFGRSEAIRWGMYHLFGSAGWNERNKSRLLSVRCVKDGGETETAGVEAKNEDAEMIDSRELVLKGTEEQPTVETTLFINETCVVSIMRIEDDAPEDETGDVAYYTFTASEKFEKSNLKTVRVFSNDYRYVFFMLDNGENFIVDIKEPFSNGGDFLYKKGEKPMEFSMFQLGFDNDESSWKKIGAYFGMTWKDMRAMFEDNDGDLSLPPVIDLYQYQNEYSPSESNFRFWGWSKDGQVAYSYDFSDGGETTSSVRIFNFVENKNILSREGGRDRDDEGNLLPPDKGFIQDFRISCEANGIELVQAEYRQLPIVHNNKTYKVVLEMAKVEREDGPEVVDNYRILVDTDGKRKVVYKAKDEEYDTYNIFLLGYFISPFENKALLVMGTHIIGGHIFTSFVGCDLEGGFDTAATEADTADTPNTFTDKRDGRKYKTVRIGGQVWMAENLNFAAEGGKCYGDDPENCAKYGRLYDWETAKKACPAGWHLPSYEEWQTLIDFVGGSETGGKKLKSAAGWNKDGNDGNGTDDYGWSALPGGIGFSDGNVGFGNAGAFGYWWSATGGDDYGARGFVMGYEIKFVNWDNYDKTELLSVRCVQDASITPAEMIRVEGGVFTDKRDGQVYKTVKIGEQVWMAENLKYAAEGSEYYENKDDYYVWMGCLYNWETAMKACPKGWHLPSDEEWQTLIDFVGGSDVAGKKLKSAVGWSDGDGTDDYGFSALPGGAYAVGEFDGLGERGGWWSASEESAYFAWTRHMQYDSESVYRGSGSKGDLFSVRCVQDSDKPSAEAPSVAAPKKGAFTDSRDGKKLPSLTPSEIGQFVSVGLANPNDGDAYYFHADPNGKYYHFESFASDGDTQWDGLWYSEKFTATSTLAPQGKVNYSAENLQNNKVAEDRKVGGIRGTTWCEGVKGYGTGERVTMSIETRAAYNDVVSFDALLIVNGYAKDAAAWKNNTRVKTLRLYVGGRAWCDLQLSDVMKPQIFTLPDDLHIVPAKSGKVVSKAAASAEETNDGNRFPAYKTDLTFEIIEVYPGDKYDDTCITGIALDILTSGVY